MAILPILTGSDNKILRTEAMPVGAVTPELRMLARDMDHTMKEAKGIGLAAPQIGRSVRMFVVDREAFVSNDSSFSYTDDVTPIEALEVLAFIDPRITKFGNRTDIAEEGCLSLPKIEGAVERSKKIEFNATNINGNPIVFKANGLLARVIQHETDHLDGVLIVDKFVTDVDPKKRVNYKQYRQ